MQTGRLSAAPFLIFRHLERGRAATQTAAQTTTRARRHGRRASAGARSRKPGRGGRAGAYPGRDASAVCPDGTGRARRTAAQQRARTRTTTRAAGTSGKPNRGRRAKEPIPAETLPPFAGARTDAHGTGRARRTATRQHRQRAAAQTTNSGAFFSHPSRPSPVPPSLSHPSRPRPLSQPSPVLPASPLNLFFCS